MQAATTWQHATTGHHRYRGDNPCATAASVTAGDRWVWLVFRPDLNHCPVETGIAANLIAAMNAADAAAVSVGWVLS